ncbi:BCCT family transporter [Corynebacterium jeikeium]|jgi:choline/carnitine/betaine transport|uniref:BCCT family transporter n=1 Tax=Corynebacterium jeikeium TaxID=38289 RepID=UPI0001B7158D|nr:BCCT family transporter [Corynebacterium jeikeium]EEW17275.1 transporter, betaine/carnitine/choline family [Corynebacterium jeikeium ATCC 43734]OOD32521.1 glycine/betaine ABC transporter [Corynebacterium jeikeium]WCZ54185.1 Glycine betaine transporter BetP [Corynebacterium jeikeium]SQI20313.1 choline-glycine betaine transporter [Corynebacterium jeikeium]SUY80509.1 choline-glycine betaine transporter [Corynebacterium jeikeium]
MTVSREEVTPTEADQEQSIDWVVTGCAAALILAVVLWGIFGGDSFAAFASTALSYVVGDWGWLYVLAGTVFVGFILFIAFSKFGHIRLGKDNEPPEFNSVSWVAMMFAAGMGIGLMFYGVTEPLTYYRDGVPGEQKNDVASSFASTLFHWGLHPWSLYAIVALAIAYGTFRLGRKQLLSAAFIPLIGEKRAEGALGKIIDIAAIFATVFGTAASLGLGAVQIQSGLDATGLISNPGTWVIVGTIVILGLCFLASAASGVGKGIQYLSNTNMVLAGLIALFVLILGPTVVILNLIPTSLGNYLSQFFQMAARTANSGDGADEWLGTWTIFYWAWWVSWSPFVGMFLARISRGRTIREFVCVVLMVPTMVTIIWFSIFGGAAVNAEETGNSIWGDGEATSQLFNLLQTLPMGQVASIIAMILLATFFITSADSASTVMGSMSQRGQLVANRGVTVLWGALTAIIALMLLLTGGDEALTNLQNVTIIAASPFLLVIIALMFSIYKALSNDQLYLDEKAQREYALRMARERRINEQSEAKAAKRSRRYGGGSDVPQAVADGNAEHS